MERQQTIYLLENFIKTELVKLVSFLEEFSLYKKPLSFEQKIEELFKEECSNINKQNKNLHYSIFFNFMKESNERDKYEFNTLTFETWEFESAELLSFPNN
jgi:hypothetical protein